MRRNGRASSPNLRLDKFKDPRVRHALLEAFDFESLNKTLFYGQYERISSYFYGLPFASSGLPAGRGARHPQQRQGQDPAGGVHHAL